MGVPRLRLGKRFIRLTRLIIPLLLVAVAVVVVAKLITGAGWWSTFAGNNPCVLPASADIDFPAWLRAMHWFNLLLIVVLFRSGIQILADHPRLYATIHSTPGREWLRFRGAVRKDTVWTALDDSTYLSPIWGLPSGRHTSGMARHWHFLSVPLWILLGVAFLVLIFATGQWQRLVPTTAEIVPGSITCAVTYAGLSLPPGEGGVSYNSLQELAYFSVVFIAAPLAILTGLAMSPALGHRFAWYERLFGNRQVARSLHFVIWCFIGLFVVVHVAMVVFTSFPKNMSHMVLGTNSSSWWGVVIGMVIIAVIVGLLAFAHWLSWHHPRKIQHTFLRIADRLNGFLFDRTAPRVEYKKTNTSPYHWTNGHPPQSPEYEQLSENDFRDYRLRVHGMVEEPREFTLEELKAMGKHSQITETDCVQGWSGVAEWGGVQVAKILDTVKPKPGARFAIFYAFVDEGRDIKYYDSHDLAQLRQPNSILAYEMNDEPLPLQYGAPLRLRNENQLGFKQIKWIESVEITDDYRGLYKGQGGFREDNEFVGRRAEI